MFHFIDILFDLLAREKERGNKERGEKPKKREKDYLRRMEGVSIIVDPTRFLVGQFLSYCRLSTPCARCEKEEMEEWDRIKMKQVDGIDWM